MNEVKTYVKLDEHTYKFSNDACEIQEAHASSPQSVVHATSEEEAILKLNELEGIIYPQIKWRPRYSGSNSPAQYFDKSGGAVIDRHAKVEVIVKFLQDNEGSSYSFSGTEFMKDWAKAGIARNKQDEIRWDKKAAKRSLYKRKVDRNAIRHRKGAYLAWDLKDFVHSILDVIRKLTGVPRLSLWGYQRTTDVESGLRDIIDTLQKNEVELKLSDYYNRTLHNMLPYVHPPTYMEFTEDRSNRRVILDFIRSEAIRFGFITEPKCSKENDNE